MALIKCEECGKEISEDADACPNCGSPMNEEETEEWKKALGMGCCSVIMLIIFVLFSLAFTGVLLASDKTSGANKHEKFRGTGLSVSNYLEFMEENNLILDDKGTMPESSNRYPSGTVSRFYESGEISPRDDIKMQLFGPSDDLYQVKLHSLYFSNKSEAIEKLMLIEQVARIYYRSKMGELEKDAVVDVSNLKKADWKTIRSQLSDFHHATEHDSNVVEASVTKEKNSPEFSLKFSIATKKLVEFRKAQN